jgi:hypothetical protein
LFIAVKAKPYGRCAAWTESAPKQRDRKAAAKEKPIKTKPRTGPEPV